MKTTEIIETSIGSVRGYIDGDLKIFKGIPYAERPIGELRFKSPVPRKKWFGVFDALDYSPISVQNSDYPGWVLPPTPQSEADSLTLNIWTPGTDNKKRSAMVWLHGGGLTSGSGRLNNGFKLARRGNIIIISINYRLGALGFSEMKGIESNIGILDQIEALKWIRKNIGLFGGDPNSITIFGFSAGGWSASILMGIPAARGLFKRVIAQSGAAHPLSFQTEKGKDRTKRMLNALKLNEGDKESLLRVNAYRLVKAYSSIAIEDEITKNPWVLTVPPYIDGKTIPEHPLSLIKKGAASDIDLLVGSTLTESAFVDNKSSTPRNLDMEQVRLRIIKVIELLGYDDIKGSEMFEVYKDVGDPEAVLVAFNTDLDFHISAIRLAEEQSIHNPKTYMYLFTYPIKYQGKEVGAIHGGDVGYIHGTLDDPKTGEIDNLEEAQLLSEKIMDSWIAFAKTGNPNHEGIEEWSKYDKNTRKTMFLGKETISVDDPMGKQRIAWEDIMKI